MAICIFRILTYVGQGLDLAVGNRPIIVAQSGHAEQDYRNGNSVKKKSEVNSVGGGNLLHLRTYPYKGTHRDDLSHWLVYNDDGAQASSSASGWSPTGVFIDDTTFKEPRDLQTVFFALSPAVLNVLYPNLVPSLLRTNDPFVDYDDGGSSGGGGVGGGGGGGGGLGGGGGGGGNDRYRRAMKHQQQQQLHHHYHQHHLGTDLKRTKGVVNGPPILVCETGEKIVPDHSRHPVRYEDEFEQRAAHHGNLKTDLTTFKCTETGRVLQSADFVSKQFGYHESNKIPEKRNHITVGRRSVHMQSPETNGFHPETLPPVSAATGGASIASQFMLRSTRGNRQYDVPQVECPISEDGMERFACPTADRTGRYRCIDDHVLCDGFIDCPAGEDEDRQACMFYKTTKAHLDVLADAILRWARGR